jgi:fucose permease
MPTVLQDEIESQIIQSWAPDNAGFIYNLFYTGFDDDSSSLIHTVYAWTNCLMSLLAGFLVDRLGTRKSTILFASLCLVGQVIFSTGALVNKFALFASSLSLVAYLTAHDTASCSLADSFSVSEAVPSALSKTQ